VNVHKLRHSKPSLIVSAVVYKADARRVHVSSQDVWSNRTHEPFSGASMNSPPLAPIYTVRARACSRMRYSLALLPDAGPLLGSELSVAHRWTGASLQDHLSGAASNRLRAPMRCPDKCRADRRLCPDPQHHRTLRRGRLRQLARTGGPGRPLPGGLADCPGCQHFAARLLARDGRRRCGRAKSADGALSAAVDEVMAGTSPLERAPGRVPVWTGCPVSCGCGEDSWVALATGAKRAGDRRADEPDAGREEDQGAVALAGVCADVARATGRRADAPVLSAPRAAPYSCLIARNREGPGPRPSHRRDSHRQGCNDQTEERVTPPRDQDVHPHRPVMPEQGCRRCPRSDGRVRVDPDQQGRKRPRRPATGSAPR
jgi:hypothetical protein